MRLSVGPLIGVLVSVSAVAQTPQAERPGSVRVVVHDATDLPITGAGVALMGPSGSTVRVTTNDHGEAHFEGLAPGVYSGRVESVGFNATAIGQFTIRAGANETRGVTLQIAGFVEALDVTPGADDQQLTTAFTRQLTADELAALPEDPEELALVLQQLVGDDADIRVDGFRGGRLPPGTHIQEIRIRDDVGAASSGGGPRVDIRTTPGGDRWRNSVSMSVQDESLKSRNAFWREQPTGQTRQYSWTLNGPLVSGRTGLSAEVNGSTSMGNQMIRAVTLDGTYSTRIEQPSNRIGFWTRIDHQISPAQTVRVDVTRNASKAQSQGVGVFDLPERAFTSTGSDAELQIAHHAMLRPGYVNDFRFAFALDSQEAIAVSGGPTIRVLDAFTSGGAEQQGGRRSRTLQVENELVFTVRRRHEVTASVSLDAAHYRGDEHSNALGTYTFASLAAFGSGQPTTFTQRVGHPTYAYSMYGLAGDVQDDFRARNNLMFNVGVRYNMQTHLRDRLNLSPRIGANWTPSSKARTTLRASVATSHSQLTANIYQQILLVNGLRQWDLVISDPGYPDSFSAGVAETVPAPSIIRGRPDLEMPRIRRYTVGLDQPIGRFFRFRGTLSRQTGHNLFRSRNANAPIDGIRPDPSVQNVTELESTARSLNDSLQTELSIGYPPKRLSSNVSYAFGKTMDETDGAFSLPSDSFDLTGEWGPARGDVRHRLNATLNTDLPGRFFRVSINFRAQSAPVYNITTGNDTNGDGLHNERPAGISRNSGRGVGTKNLDLTMTWRLGFGQRNPGGQRRDQSTLLGAVRDNDPLRFEVFARATNVLNLVNPQNFSGVLSSPFFGMPTSAGAARVIVVGTRAWF